MLRRNFIGMLSLLGLSGGSAVLAKTEDAYKEFLTVDDVERQLKETGIVVGKEIILSRPLFPPKSDKAHLIYGCRITVDFDYPKWWLSEDAVISILGCHIYSKSDGRHSTSPRPSGHIDFSGTKDWVSASSFGMDQYAG